MKDESKRKVAGQAKGAGREEVAGQLEGAASVVDAAGAPEAAAEAAGAPAEAAGGANASAASGSDIPEGFTLGLAIVDAIPVLEFCASTIVIALRFQSVLFVLGAVCSALAGCGKVLWKIILACAKRNVPWLNKQFRYLMSAGFILMLVAVLVAVAVGNLQLGAILRRIFAFPAIVFFALGVAGMVAMGVMGAKLDKNVARNNWIEQITNAVAQGMFLVGIILW